MFHPVSYGSPWAQPLFGTAQFFYVSHIRKKSVDDEEEKGAGPRRCEEPVLTNGEKSRVEGFSSFFRYISILSAL